MLCLATGMASTGSAKDSNRYELLLPPEYVRQALRSLDEMRVRQHPHSCGRWFSATGSVLGQQTACADILWSMVRPLGPDFGSLLTMVGGGSRPSGWMGCCFGGGSVESYCAAAGLGHCTRDIYFPLGGGLVWLPKGDTLRQDMKAPQDSDVYFYHTLHASYPILL